MLLIPLSAFGYAQWNHTLTATAYLASGTEDIEITAWQIISTNSYDVNCNDEIPGDELIIKNLNDENGQVVGLEITADPIFPDWHLKLVVEIHNAGNLALYLSSEIQQEDETPLTDTQLLDLFRIEHTDGFYLNPGPDGTWFTDDDEEIPDLATWQLLPDYNWYKLEHLVFDAQDFPGLQDQIFTFHVVIYGTSIGGG